MCALSPLTPHDYRWPALESFGLEKENFYALGPTESGGDPAVGFSLTSFQEVQLDRFASSSEDPSRLKKLCHNANERNRRKKLNSLYSSLRSLLPATDQGKKLSIPATVSRVLQYLPQLQLEVERLAKRKEELLERLSRQSEDHLALQERRKQITDENSAPGIIVHRLNDREIVVQMSAIQGSPLSETFLVLEEYGLHVMAAACFMSPRRRVFLSIHLEIERYCHVTLDRLNEELLSLFQIST